MDTALVAGGQTTVIGKMNRERRRWLQGMLGLAGGAALLKSEHAQAAGVPLLTETEPMAVALAYRANAKTVDRKKFPTYDGKQTCANCNLLAFGTAIKRPCSIIPGRLVNAGGWCKVWVKRGAK
jgi:hypothetical protein